MYIVYQGWVGYPDITNHIQQKKEVIKVWGLFVFLHMGAWAVLGLWVKECPAGARYRTQATVNIRKHAFSNSNHDPIIYDQLTYLYTTI